MKLIRFIKSILGPMHRPSPTPQTVHDKSSDVVLSCNNASDIRIEAFGDTNLGRVRANNEDAYLCDEGRGLYVVADGMGGHAAGEQASRIAVDVLSDKLCTDVLRESAAEGDEAIRSLLSNACREASKEIVSQAAQNPELMGMGSTVVVGVLNGKTLYIANVGDSRAYLIRSGQAELLSKDDSVVSALVDQGELSEDQIRSHPLRNQLTAALGIVRGDEVYTIDPHIRSVHVETGDRIVLCSDGLWDMVEDSDIARIVSNSSTAKDAVSALIEAANEAGGEDNISVVVVFIEVPAHEQMKSEIKYTHPMCEA